MKKLYLIAEIGINNNRDLNIAKKLIKNKKICGFNAVKFQKRTVDFVYDKNTLDSYRESPWCTITREQKLGLEFEKKEDLERHITLDRTTYGSDQAVSLELSGMENLSDSIKKILISLGKPSVGKIVEDEIPIAKKLQAHL